MLLFGYVSRESAWEVPGEGFLFESQQVIGLLDIGEGDFLLFADKGGTLFAGEFLLDLVLDMLTE